MTGRSEPAPRWSWSAIAARCRAASLLLAASLVAYSTSIVATVYSISTGAVSVSVDSQAPIHNVTLALLIPSLLRLAIAVGWILNTRRTTLAIIATLFAYFLSTRGLGGPTVFDLTLLVPVGAAVAWRWPAPRRRVVMLATIPFAVLLWTLIAAWDAHPKTYSTYLVGPLELPAVTAIVALLGAVSGLLPHRPSRNSQHPNGLQDRPTRATG